jgi:methylated-DNA-[protein]-cysteine S-methyltransferase
MTAAPSAKPASCRALESDLIASAAGEAEPRAVDRVTEHVQRCRPCRDELAGYRQVETLAGELRHAVPDAGQLADARRALDSRLADLRRRCIAYGIFGSPLGRILIARSEEGVTLVEYLGSEGLRDSRLSRVAELETLEDSSEVEPLHRELLEFLGGDRRRLDWPLDWRLATSGFQRDVLRATAALPYGAVTSYGHLARELGRPRAVRAVAQALRHNPLPIVVPCHRVIGGSGGLTGYAGSRIELKQRLLTVEGVPTAAARARAHIVRSSMYVRPDAEREYCLPTCGALSTLPLARLTLYAARESAESVGLRPCGDCRPDLHPILS